MKSPKNSAPFFSVPVTGDDTLDKQCIETGYRTNVIAGNANKALAASVAAALHQSLCNATSKTFANGEISIKFNEPIRGDDCFIIQPTTGSPTIDVNTALMELMLMIHTLKLACAKRITAIVPYFAYSRQDRKMQSRVPISASAVAQLIQCMGVDRVVTLDLHCGQIQGFFRNLPVDNLLMFPEFCKYVSACEWFDPSTTVIVSPDAGGVERATVVADRLGASHIVTILKRRKEAGKVDSMQTVGDVNGYNCVIVDDMIDTGGTLVKACDLLKEMGAARVMACASHGILTDPACERINNCDALDEVVVSDSIPQDHNIPRCPKLTVRTIAPMLAEAIKRLHKEESLSSMFTK
eukprot:Tbor_TRINITY_DN5331_c2_g4::TRINITY_DN5331_c2_g4_i1::g.4733::m.4733/K00948/PRPS, prsA; ribose-phosphate pyrophosphokinase